MKAEGHFTVCAVCKLVVDVFATTANVHNANPEVIDLYLQLGKKRNGMLFFADAGYTGSFVYEKGFRNKPLTNTLNESNKQISSIRCRIKHTFGFIEKSLKGSIVRSVEQARAKFNILLTALGYNIFRLCQFVKQTKVKVVIT